MTSSDPPPVLVVCCGRRLQVAVDSMVQCTGCATLHHVTHDRRVRPLELIEEDPGEDWDYWACPTCEHPICDWCDCPECGWMNGVAWEATLGEGSA